MKVALITSMKYGLTQFIFRDIKALNDKGHQVVLFSLINKKGLYNPLPEWKVVPLTRLRILWRQLIFIFQKPLLYLKLFKEALLSKSLQNLFSAVCFADKMSNFDIIFSYFGDHKFFTGYYCKKILNIPLTVTIRAYELYANPNPDMFRKALAFCDRILTITEHNKSILISNYSVPVEKIDIIRQILDLDTYQYKEKIKILIVGYFAEKKGHEILLKAVKKLNRDDIELWIVGDMVPWVVKVDIRKLVKEMGMESQVAFFGPQRDTALRALYNECDIFCLPSRKDRKGDNEGFPNVIAEAMAFSKPVISTKHAGIPEAIDSILVEENNIEELALAIQNACNSAELRKELGQNNRKRAEQMFSEKNNDQLEKILLKYALTAEKTA